MNINFDTDRVVIFIFPKWAGGKFIMNCLGLSDYSVLQDATLAEKQLDGQFDRNAKLDYILSKLDSVVKTKNWDDLGLGCKQLFGSNERDYADTSLLEFNQVIDTLSNKDFLLLFGAHSTAKLLNMLSVWKNATLLVFTNTTNFRRLRYTNLVETDWTEWDKEVTAFFEEHDIPNNIYYFNNDIYFDEKRTVDEIEKLYSLLKLDDFDRSIVTQYYKAWIRKCIPNELLKSY